MKELGIKIADLDKINNRKYYFSLHGVDHEVCPPSMGDWFEIVNSNQNLWSLKDREKLTTDEVVDSYFELLSKMCPTLTKDDIRKSKQWQLTALWQIGVDMMNGYEEKKTLTSMLLMGLKKEELTKMIMILNQLLSTLPESLQKSALEPAG